eukprot:7178110-Prymnesium_polylepis.1
MSLSAQESQDVHAVGASGGIEGGADSGAFDADIDGSSESPGCSKDSPNTTAAGQSTTRFFARPFQCISSSTRLPVSPVWPRVLH